MDYVTVDAEVIPQHQLVHLHFVLKLWMVTTTELVEYIRWNQDQTCLLVNEAVMAEQWREGNTAIFLVNRVEDFRFLLKVHGFESCTVEMLDESERVVMDAGWRVYYHRHFTAGNCEYFNDWLASPEDRMNDFERKRDGMIQQKLRWEVAKELYDFFAVSQKIKSTMMHLDRYLKDALGRPGTTHIDIPAEYIDQETVPMPHYGSDVAGNYGAVSREELDNFFGTKLPKYVDAVAMQDNSPATMMIEEVQERPTPDWDAGYILPHAAPSQRELEQSAQYEDMKEMYESVDFWPGDGDDGTVIETYEIANDDDNDPQAEVKHELEGVGVRASLDNDNTMPPMPENMTQFLTNCMSDLLQPIDFD